MDTIREQFLLIFSTPLYLIIIGLELAISHFHGIRAYTWRDTSYNFYLSLLRGGTELLMTGFSVAALSFFFNFRLFSPSLTFFYWIILVLAIDFMHYWLHRLSHYCRFFWAVHVNHHSSSHFNFSVGFRSAVLEPLYGFLFLAPVALLGFRPADIIFIYALSQIWAVLTHTERVGKLGWLEKIMVTPSHHRVHHASNPLYLDKNMGAVFIFWDKLLGTFQEELPADAYQPIRYGLTSPIKEVKLSTVIFHEWAEILKDIRRKDIGWKEKCGYTFGPPGWSHDGSRSTSREMRQQEQET